MFVGRKRIVLVASAALLLTACTSTFSGRAWLDENKNGIQDPDEPGLSGVTVDLFMIGLDDDIPYESVSTDANGLYTFQAPVNNNSGGENFPYQVVFHLPLASMDYSFAQQDQGEDDTVDSDVDFDGRSPTSDISTIVDAGFVLVNSQVQANLAEQPAPTATPTTAPTPTPTSDSSSNPQGAVLAQDVCYGPAHEDFPEGVSPLSGLPVSDPTMLDLRPVFLSVSIFPPSVRPPTGLAVAPIIYELYIGDGDTRLMAGFYGEYPTPTFVGEDGETSDAPEGFDITFGGRVWFDSNANHLQDEGEPGVASVPVRLVDINLSTVATTQTDTAGRYYFGLNDVAINTEFQIRLGAPPNIADFYWVNKDLGNDDIDSDVTALGFTDFFDPTEFEGGQKFNIDGGLRQAYRIEGIRSGRVAFQDLQVNYCGCLVTAGADPQVAAEINTCATAANNDPENIGGAGLDVTNLQGVASNNTQGVCAEPNLSGNLFCTQVEIPGEPGQELFVEYNINNKNHFVYDHELNAYLWHINRPSDNQVYDLMTDRLTGEPLAFENVVVMFVPHVAQNQAVTIINLQMQSARGRAIIFRNGQKYEAEWSTQFPSYVTDRDRPIPVHFEVNGAPFPLAPGQTWINLLNQGDTIQQIGDGIWLADFDAPAYHP